MNPIAEIKRLRVKVFTRNGSTGFAYSPDGAFLGRLRFYAPTVDNWDSKRTPTALEMNGELFLGWLNDKQIITLKRADLCHGMMPTHIRLSHSAY